ncbi:MULTISPECIES: GntR family transcriptional regulator [unclassified Streptomyces]|uniref:GntR family transcriptional regulator n=1 Tax=unclassified Streptomyces TaxID=2593676 RepID=UPI00332C424B
MTGPAVRVDTTGPVPPYEQIRSQLAALIGGGVLPEGERLPTVRQLAADLGLAPGTVNRAYKELEAAGLVRTRRGAGTRVAARPGTAPVDTAALTRLARAYVTGARATGADEEAVLAAVRAALDAPRS